MTSLNNSRECINDNKMLEKISEVIRAITDFLGGFSKLNEVKDHSIRIFFQIILCTLIALFLGKLFMRDDLYDWVVSIIMKPNPITIAVVVGLAMIVYSMYSQKRIMNAVLMAIQQQKQNEKQKDKECYAQTSRIEEEANELTDYLREILHCDIWRFLDISVIASSNACCDSVGTNVSLLLSVPFIFLSFNTKMSKPLFS